MAIVAAIDRTHKIYNFDKVKTNVVDHSFLGLITFKRSESFTLILNDYTSVNRITINAKFYSKRFLKEMFSVEFSLKS